jgi:hypothetical protein
LSLESKFHPLQPPPARYHQGPFRFDRPDCHLSDQSVPSTATIGSDDPSNHTMSVATMLQPASRQSRASSSSSSSFQPVARQNTMSSHDTRSIRQSKRMSVTALYLSMSAKDRDLEISDDLARGTFQSASPMVALTPWQHKNTCGT